MKKRLKEHLVSAFVVSLAVVTVGYGIFGYLAGSTLSTEPQKPAVDTSDLPWSVSPNAGYTLIEETIEDNHFRATTADGSKVCIDGKGQLIEACSAGHRFTNGLIAFTGKEGSGLKNAYGETLVEDNIYYFEDCGEYLITFSDADDQWKSAVLYDSKGRTLIHEKDYCHLSSLGDDWFFAECDSSYVYNAKTGEKHFVDEEMLMIYPDGKGGFYGEIGPKVEVYPLDQKFQLVKDGISFSYMADLSEGLRYVQMNQPDKPTEDIYAYVDKDNQVVINLRNEDGAIPTMASPFSEGKAFLQVGAKLFCIDKDGEVLFEHPIKSKSYNIEETVFHEGYAPLSLDDDSFDLLDSEKLYGYVNVSGDFVIEQKLYAAKAVRGGYAIAAADADHYGILQFE